MSEKSLGLIETVGLAAAVEAADTAVKSANVTLVGYELTKGDGMVTVKLEGEVGAVNAAVSAAAAAAEKVNHVYSTRVIARPSVCVAPLVKNALTVGVEPEVPAAVPVQEVPEAKPEKEPEPAPLQEVIAPVESKPVAVQEETPVKAPEVPAEPPVQAPQAPAKPRSKRKGRHNSNPNNSDKT